MKAMTFVELMDIINNLPKANGYAHFTGGLLAGLAFGLQNPRLALAAGFGLGLIKESLDFIKNRLHFGDFDFIWQAKYGLGDSFLDLLQWTAGGIFAYYCYKRVIKLNS